MDLDVEVVNRHKFVHDWDSKLFRLMIVLSVHLTVDDRAEFYLYKKQ